MILEVFSAGPFDTNTILIGCSKTKKAVLIDVPFESTDRMLGLIKEHGLTLEKIILTHSHWDHIAEISPLMSKLKTKVPVYVHEEDRENLEKPGSDRLPYPPFSIECVKPDGFLTDGQIISVGTLELQVMHTPGHSPGSVCFYLKKEKILITGDTLFRGTIGNLNFPTARPARMWPSLKKIAQLPADTVVIPGHGGRTTIGEESWISDAEGRFNI